LVRLKADSNGSYDVFISDKVGRALGWIKRGFAAACREVRVENFTFHGLRHNVGTRIGDAGIDAFKIAKVLGHSDLRMTSRCTQATGQNLR
jgi:integrase